MAKTAPITAISALLILLPIASSAQATGNPWNPYPRPPVQAVPVPQYQPLIPVQTPVQSPVQSRQSQQQQQAPSRFAPPGLEQQLAARPLTQVAPAAPAARQTPPDNAQQGIPPTYYAPQAGGYPGGAGYAPQQGYGYAPQAPYGPGQGYGGNPQAYGGFPGGFGNNGYNGYGGNGGYGNNGPFSPFGFPGGSGGTGPFPGNLTNGGVPGFGISPFGFF